MFQSSWAAGVCVRPAGAPALGAFWLPFLAAGLIVALLLASAVPPAPRKRRQETDLSAGRGRRTPALAFDPFFILLLACLAAIILIGYFR